ncbi:MAG: gamma-glutamyltransferase, partial [Treponema sp.]|nr:gamma-glutamyltransferase [Treponema sp.]
MRVGDVRDSKCSGGGLMSGVTKIDKKRKGLKAFGISAISIVLVLAIVYLCLPKKPAEYMEFDDPYRQERTLATGEKYMASTGTPWATQVAIDMMDRGGNAFDAAMAALLTLNVTFSQAASFPGVAPILIYDAQSGTVKSYIG